MNKFPVWQIGLTGGIGSGKSTVASQLSAHGATWVDTDAIARSLTAPSGGAIPALVSHFGPDILDPSGGLDRAAMRTRVFSDTKAKKQLEAVLHPLIREQVENQVATCATPVVVLDVPLLVESGRWRARVDQVWVVDCEEETQVGRVTKRPGWTQAAARAVIHQQARREYRRGAADVVIYNDGINLVQLAQQVEALWTELTKNAKPSP
jgi:dephospho-CoA kinase